MVLVVDTLVVLGDVLDSFDFLLHCIYPFLNRISCYGCHQVFVAMTENTLTPYLVVRGSDCHVYIFILIYTLGLERSQWYTVK